MTQMVVVVEVGVGIKFRVVVVDFVVRADAMIDGLGNQVGSWDW